MRSVNLRIFLLTAFCSVAALSVLWFPAGQDNVLALDATTEAKTLTIGSAAPAIDVEHWVSDGQGFFKPIKQFEQGNVYVVEFWATWCGPCIQSMPHLVDLQNKYRGQKVQIISISDEPLETVQEFLARETEGPNGAPTTFGALTSAYCLTTDPDGSVQTDYMEAAKQGGIPTAFIVGKDGKIEWIGHPMEMDEPLAAVVAGNWNRNEFAEVFIAQQTLSETMNRLSQLAGSGQFAEAVKVIDGELAKKLPEDIKNQLTNIKQQLKLMGGLIDAEVTATIRTQLENARGNAIGVGRLAVFFQQLGMQVPGLLEKPEMKPLVSEVVAALKAEVAGAEAEIRPMMLDTAARLEHAVGDVQQAIATLETAVAATTDADIKAELQSLIDEIKAEQK